MGQAPDLASYIEHTTLKAGTTYHDIEMLCSQARHFAFYGVCVPPVFIPDAKELLRDTDIKVITVIGFPLGYNKTEVKEQELITSIEDGADEVDVVCNIGWVKSGEFEKVSNELKRLTYLSHQHKRLIKVIIETPLLGDEEIRRVCDICEEANADCIKTCTGFSGGVELRTVRLIRELVSDNMLVKASGGIKTKAFALQLIEAGANRLGTSSGVDIMSEL